MPNQPTPFSHLSDDALVRVLTGARQSRTSEAAEAYQADALQHLAEAELVDVSQALRLTPAATKRLGAAFELHRRLLKAKRPRTAIREPSDVAQLMTPVASREYECMWCLALDARSHLIGEPIQISQGDIDGTEAGPRLFFRNALRRGAVTAIAVHNHPTGSCGPSAADVTVTKRLIAAGQGLDLACVDHVIIGAGGRSHSMRRSHSHLWA
jgi:DNA repair protein RadC